MSSIDQAMILAAGLGTRMGPLTSDKPKPLVELHGRTLIDHVIDRLARGGVNFVVVNVHFKAEMMKAHLAARKDVSIQICDETDNILDTGGAIANALPLFRGAPFFTQNSDSLWVEGMGRAMTRMQERWDPEKMDALMLLAPCATSIGYDGPGDFEMDPGGRLRRRVEMKLAPFVWTGLQIVHPRLFDGAPSGRFSINPLWDKAIENERLFGIRLDGVWMHVGTPEAKSEAELFLTDLQHQP
ncbi:MAG: nucleotidyltransferase family protein [Micropepsaceae bacterium]